MKLEHGGEEKEVIVLDDHDDPAPWLVLGEGHYPVTKVEMADNGMIVVILDYHKIYQHFRHVVLNPPSSGPSSRKEDPGSP